MKFSKTLIIAVLLVSSARAYASLPDATRAWLDKNSKTITKLYVSGGTSSIDDATVAGAQAAAQNTNDTASSVKVESFTGTIKITKKDGTTVELTQDGKTAMPVLKDGETITVVSGSASLSSNGTTASLKAGDGVSVSGRSMTVTAGTVTFTNSKGSSTATVGQTVTAPAPASVSSTNTGSNNTTSTNDSTNSNTKGSAEQELDASSPSAP